MNDNLVIPLDTALLYYRHASLCPSELLTQAAESLELHAIGSHDGIALERKALELRSFVRGARVAAREKAESNEQHPSHSP